VGSLFQPQETRKKILKLPRCLQAQERKFNMAADTMTMHSSSLAPEWVSAEHMTGVSLPKAASLYENSVT